MKEQFNTPIVIIGASIQALELIDILLKEGRDVVVIDKFKEKGEIQSAVLRNQHTLQSGLLQILNKSADKLKEVTYQDVNYKRIASAYREIVNLYDDTNIISTERSLIEIETNAKDLKVDDLDYCPIKRYRKNVDYLGHDSRFKKTLSLNDNSSNETLIGQFAVEAVALEKSYFELPDKTIDYDKLLKIKRSQMLNDKAYKGNLFFVPKSKTISLINAKNHKFKVETDTYAFTAELVLIAAGIGCDSILKDVETKGDGSSSYLYSLLKSKRSLCNSFHCSTYAKYSEIREVTENGLNVNKTPFQNFFFAAKHGKHNVQDPSFLIVGNAKSIRINKNYDSIYDLLQDQKQNVTKSVDKLKFDFSLALGDPKSVNKIDSISQCVLKAGRRKYFPHKHFVKPHRKVVSIHAGLTSTAKDFAKDVISELKKIHGASFFNRLKIDTVSQFKLGLICVNEHDKIKKNGTLIVINRNNNIREDDHDKAWFRVSS